MGASEAARLLGVVDGPELLADALRALRTPAAATDEVWAELRNAFSPASDRWAKPKKIALVLYLAK